MTSEPRQNFADLTTQRWVKMTGRRVKVPEHPWLAGPVGDVDRIGMDFFSRYAAKHNLALVNHGSRGLLPSFESLAGPTFDPAKVASPIVEFYEHTSDFEFDVWSEWSGFFRPFGAALAAIFSRRLQQLSVPLSPLDTKFGMNSHVVRLVGDGEAHVTTAWLRESVATNQTVYAGSYSTCSAPGFPGPCVRVAFPLPNGYALVVMRPEADDAGSLTLRSDGKHFGDPGFYFVVQDSEDTAWARYVPSFKESIHVFLDARGEPRADHDLNIWGRRFLRLHYRMRQLGGDNG